MIIKILTIVSRYLLALVFIFSGFVKGVDPLGSMYKLTDYFLAFELSFLEPFSLFLSFLLCAAELFIGLLLLFGTKLRTAAWGAFLFMSIFTPLTLVIALLDPVSDCGCFGDAIVLSNWGTFFKNIPLFLAAWLVFVRRKALARFPQKAPENIMATLLLVISFLPSYHGYQHLPMIDFRPYSVGTNLAEAMSTPPGAPADEYQTLLYYEKDGVTKEFNEHNFPWQDSTWKFVDSKSVLLKAGYQPPISDFSLSNREGLPVTDSIVHHKGFYLLAFSHRIDIANKEGANNLNPLYFMAQNNGYGFALVTASNHEEVDQYIGQHGALYPIYTADEIMIKTVVRSNPGLLLLYNGTIIGKYHHNDFPDPSFFQGDMVAKCMSDFRKRVEGLRGTSLAIGILLLLSALYLFSGRRRIR